MFYMIIILSLLLIFALAKVVQYKNRITKIQNATWTSFDNAAKTPPAEALDNLMRDIWNALYH